jgi:hypothetical protein
MGMSPEFEEITKAIQTLSVGLIAMGDGASEAILAELNGLFATIETVCAEAAQELEAKLLLLAQTQPPARVVG